MNWRAQSLALAALLVFVPGRAEAQDAADAAPQPPAITTTTSQAYPAVSCTSADSVASSDALQLAADARDQLAPLLKLGPDWRFPVHIHIMTPDDPLLAKINREASAVFTSPDGTTMKIEAVLPSTDPDARAFIQRQFVTALLWEKYFSNKTLFDKDTKLDAVPLWLVEGLREWLNDDTEHDHQNIVRRALQTQRAPKLAEVLGWTEVSHDHLQALWQRSFCFCLVNGVTRVGSNRNAFHEWLDALSSPAPLPLDHILPNEDQWHSELGYSSQQSRDIVYTWDETVAEMAALDVVAIPSDKPADTHLCTMETVATFPRDKNMTVAVQHKILDLTALELRAHPSWRAILALYRFGLTALVVENDPEKAKKLLAQAHELRATEMDTHQKLVDYVNWFEVTKIDEGNTTHFQSYFSTAKDMEDIQADPKHPNPIRADLLQIESQL